MSPTSIADVLRALTREPGRPRLTWYGPGGERVELSGAVLENWVNKTANLLVEEFDIGPGARVQLDLPPHWRTVVWAFAVWRVGGCVELAGGQDPVEVIVTDNASSHRHAPVVAVALPALARAYGPNLPPGAIDAAAAVMTYGDALGYVPPLDLQAPAVDTTAHVTHAELVGWSQDGKSASSDSRVVVRSRDNALEQALRETLAVLASGGSVVLLAPPVADELRADAVRQDRLVTTERVTAIW
ncbi:TIGR03089 family protein [Cellulomonas chengniuliangii]|uniref:TIGR03089 family protein n=1 Tax=Cellulomonas chengniuliangii TaxID=2968084 RepID=A0ABY5KYH4_9CELL|nr:TIGR03089 family protein [Cellulomonas chengniuliangii]MCC2308748.1 TIGR03089 family protein [Cellulomonas chengniuliangii]UUI74501.1 TIGR03089 family protein [Cellulomonas chengniuliangii]